MGNAVFRVPMGVTTISARDYENKWDYQGEETIVLPESVTEIGPNAFWGCNTLKHITIPGSVEIIDGEAFAECENLESVTISPGVKEIGGGAFYHCRKLKSIDIPDSVQAMYNGAFRKCEKLEHVRLSPNIEKLFSYTFEGCKSLKSIDISNISQLGDSVFENSGLESIELPYDVIWIPMRAFAGCKNLKEIDLSEIRIIGMMAFKGSGLENVKVGEVELEERVFSHCRKLKSVYINSAEIPSHTFFNCTALEEVRFGSSTTAIRTEAFVECKALKNVTFEAPATVAGDQPTERILEKRSFINCDIDGKVVIPDGVKKLTENTFDNCNIKKLVLPDSLEDVGVQSCFVEDELQIMCAGLGLKHKVIRQLVTYKSFNLSTEICDRIEAGVKLACIEISGTAAEPDGEPKKIGLSNTSCIKADYESARKYDIGTELDCGTIRYDFTHLNGCFEGSCGIELSVDASAGYSLKKLIDRMKGCYEDSDAEFEDLKRKVAIWNTNKIYPFAVKNDVFGLYIRNAGNACLYLVK